MSYLYGDSTPSSLEVNFVDFLRDSLDFCVEVVLCSAASRSEGERGEALERTARVDIERLERLRLAVASAVEPPTTGERDVPATRCATEIVTSTSNLVMAEVERINVALRADLAKIDAAQAGEREKCVKALEALVLRHDLPNSEKSLNLKARAGGTYAARLIAVTPLGITTIVELDVPSAHLFGQVVRVDRIAPRLEVQAPEVGGWLHKERRMRAHRLEKLHVIELDLDAKESFVRLRAGGDGSGPGFDVFVRPDEPRVRLMRAAERDASPAPPFDVDGADADNLIALMQKLDVEVRPLAAHRKTLAHAKLDDRPLRDHLGATVLVERLVGAMAPVVREIAIRSPSATELVLKRLVSGDRREEIFVTKAELREKIERLPPALRTIFEPLGLADARITLAFEEASGGTSQSSREGREPTTLVMPPRAAEPTTLVMPPRAPGPAARAAEPRAETNEPDNSPESIEQIDAGFDQINLQDEKPIE